jgi:pyruvate dehydrogenase E2 component (dihydrolipoamide acetyltransferase)
VEVRVPDLGEFADVEVIEVLVAPGDVVVKEDPLLTLETEKATMDVPSPASGTVRELKIGVGSRVSTGDLVLVLDAPAAAEAPPAVAPAIAAPQSEVRPEDDRTVRQPQPAPPQKTLAVTVPDLGDFSDVDVIEVLVAVGDAVRAEQGLVTLETEKAAMDVPAPVAGIVTELRVAVGSKVNAGDEVAVLLLTAAETPERAPAVTPGARDRAATAAARPAPTDRPGAQAAPSPAGRPRALPPVDEATFARAHASPSVRKLARELGVDLGRVRGSGLKGRVTADNVKAFVKEILRGELPGTAFPQVPQVDFAKFGSIELQPLSRIQKISGPRLHASWVNVPHVTQHDEADITALEDVRAARKEEAAARGIRLTPLAFVMRACVLALAEFPAFKASLSADGQSLVMKRYTHFGFAADTPNGLVVPVIRDVDRKDVFAIAKDLAELSQRARDGKLKSDDIQGGVFTISSLGGIGGTYFTPIINAPEVAILGVSRSQWKPIRQGNEFVPRLMLPLSLSYDHRVIDGAQAARFITRLSAILAEPDRLLEAPS